MEYTASGVVMIGPVPRRIRCKCGQWFAPEVIRPAILSIVVGAEEDEEINVR